jgi:hypothetical protein
MERFTAFTPHSSPVRIRIPVLETEYCTYTANVLSTAGTDAIRDRAPLRCSYRTINI